MTTENNVAAQAGDEQAALAKQLATWRAEVARLNDLIAHASGVQAGEEPMRAAFEAAYCKQYPVIAHISPDKFKRDEHGDYIEGAIFVGWDMYRAGLASPRATADVERDALYFAQQIVRTHINLDSWMRQDHACNECVPGQKSVKEGFQCFYHRAKSFIATTKPGA